MDYSRCLKALSGTIVLALGVMSACSVNQDANGGHQFLPKDDGGLDGQGGVGGGSGGIGAAGGTGGTAATGGSGGSTGGTSGAGGAGGTGATGGTAGTGGATGGSGGTAGSGGCTGQCSSSINSLTVTVGIAHAHLGELTIKLQGPSGQILTLMSRPGENEQADNGNGNGDGDSSNLESGNPVTFDDTAPTSAEDMGSTIYGNQTVCKDDGICSYSPAQGAAAGPATLSAAYAGKDSLGTWTLCVGDSIGGTFSVSGTLTSWRLDINTVGGAKTYQSGNISVAIPDDGYKGPLTSMGCSPITAN